MGHRTRMTSAVALSCAAAVGIAACGSSGGSTNTSPAQAPPSTSASSGSGGGTVTILSGTAPQSADPQGDFTTQGNELYSTVNTPLLVFKRAAGEAGTQILPGLAKALPKVSNHNKTYTFHLRPNLHYSTGQKIKASDFKFAIQRAIKINWDAKSFLTGHIAGAEAFGSGKAKSISGITTNDKTGKITVKLNAPYGPIVDVLALSGTAPVPQNTPMSPQNSKGVIGDGPYKWSTISPGHTYTLVKNPKFDVPGLPRGHAAKIVENDNSNVLANAQQVLQNQADVFDDGDTLPSSIVSQVKSQAQDRFQAVPFNSTFYFFFAVNQKPFNKLKARQAVLAGMDDRALSRLDSGFIAPDCHLIPSGLPGHSDPKNCPFHPADAPGNLKKARQLLAQSGEKGAKVTVYGENRSPRKQWADYFNDLLNKIGFNSTEKILNSQTYFQVIGNQKTKPQIGFADWVQDFPNPGDFVQLFTKAGIQPQNALNYGYVKDPHIEQVVHKLNQVPADKLQSVAGQWSALDQYMVSKAYYAAYGHEKFPKFFSDRLDFSAGQLTPGYELDLTSLQLK